MALSDKQQADMAERGVFFYPPDDPPKLKADSAAIILEESEDDVKPYLLIPDHSEDDKVPFSSTLMTAAFSLIWEDEFRDKLRERMMSMRAAQDPVIMRIVTGIKETLQRLFGEENVRIEDGDITDD